MLKKREYSFEIVAKRQSLNWGEKRILIKWYIHQNFVWWQRLKFDIVGRDEQVMLYSNIDRRNDDNDGDYYYCYCGYLAHRYITNTAPAFDDVIERRYAALLCDFCRRGAF